MCSIPTYTFANRTGELQFFWVIEIGPQWSSGSCDTYRCVFRFRRHRLRESIHMTVSATDQRCVRIGFFLKALVVLSFLGSELGDDFGRTWLRDRRSWVPETELSVGAVHITSFAVQTPVVANEQVTLLSQFVHQHPNGRPLLSLILTSEHSASTLAGNQSRGKKTTRNSAYDHEHSRDHAHVATAEFRMNFRTRFNLFKKDYLECTATDVTSAALTVEADDQTHFPKFHRLRMIARCQYDCTCFYITC